MVLDVEAMEGQPLHNPSVIEQITAIIDKGGPYYLYAASEWWKKDKWFIGLLEKNQQDDLKFKTHTEAENECERLNSEYVAKAILKCLYDQPIDFKSVYDKFTWEAIIGGMMK